MTASFPHEHRMAYNYIHGLDHRMAVSQAMIEFAYCTRTPTDMTRDNVDANDVSRTDPFADDVAMTAASARVIVRQHASLRRRRQQVGAECPRGIVEEKKTLPHTCT